MGTVDIIKKVTSERYAVSVNDLSGNRRSTELIKARHMSMYLSCEMTELSFPVIGRLFGGKDHTTVMYAQKKIARMVKELPSLTKEVEKIKHDIDVEIEKEKELETLPTEAMNALLSHKSKVDEYKNTIAECSNSIEDYKNAVIETMEILSNSKVHTAIMIAINDVIKSGTRLDNDRLSKYEGVAIDELLRAIWRLRNAVNDANSNDNETKGMRNGTRTKSRKKTAC